MVILNDLDRLKLKLDRLGKTLGIDVTFSYYEQAFIRRVLKSVVTQINNKEDKDIAKEILKKTEWLDENN